MSDLRERLSAILSNWQEPLLWLPIALALGIAAYYVIPSIDPRAGIDGWGAVWNYIVVTIAVLLAGFLAWLLHRTYFLELDDDDERELIDHACGIERSEGTGFRIGAGPTTWQAIVVLLRKDFLWLAVFWLVLSRLLP